MLHGPRAIALERRPRPALAPWQARIRVGLVGVCGTDRALYSGALPTAYPLVPGHEFVGVVIEVGDPRDREWIGRRVCADINNTCRSRRVPVARRCRACRVELEHHCQRRDVTGIHEAAGAFAEELVAPTANLFAVPDAVSDSRAMFCEPLAAALQAFEQVPVGRGELVVVLGTGRLGALIAAVARRRGADVLAVGRSAHKLARCRALDAGELRSVDELDPAALRALVDARSEGLGADVVVEATGTAEGLSSAQALVRPRGTIVLKTTCGLPSGFDLTRAVVDEVTLVGSRCGPFARALELLERDPLPVETLIEETYPLPETARAIERAGEVFKVAVQVST